MKSSLRVLSPLTIGTAQIESTNVPDTDYPVWAAGTSYGIGQEVQKSSKVFYSLLDANVGNDPEVKASLTKWKQTGVINRLRPFDGKLATKVKQANNIQYTLNMGRAVTSLAVIGVEGATSIRLVMENSGVTVFDQTVPVFPLPAKSGLWHWLYGQKEERSEAKFFNLPTYPAAKLKFTAIGSANLAIGVIAVGNISQFGQYVLSGARVGFDDFSRREKDEFGEWDLVERSYSKWAAIDLLLAKAEVDPLNKFVARMRAKPSIWIASDHYESTTVYGIVKSFEVVISYPEYSDCQLTFEGMNEE